MNCKGFSCCWYIASLLVLTLLLPAVSTEAQGISPNFQVNVLTMPDGRSLRKYVIRGPAVPPPGSELQRKSVSIPAPNEAAGVNVLEVPAYRWVFGCSAVSGAMVAGFYDRSGWDDMYTGPTNGGVMPLNNSFWPNWTDGYGATYASCPLVASMNGLDRRTSNGSIDDYWLQYLSNSLDPYVGNWDQHSWGDAIGDFMKTSQSAYNNVDGSTTFYTWSGSPAPLYCSDLYFYGVTNDGTDGRGQFYQARGYVVDDCYTQPTDNYQPGGFSFGQFMSEIDAGHPVMLNLEGHSVVGIGYDANANLVYIHDTWDNDQHSMSWGGSYAGMGLWGVSIAKPTSQRISPVTIGTSPANRPYSIDGTTYTSQHTFWFEPGSSHTIAVVSPLSLGASRYTFDRWSDGGDQSHTITVAPGQNVYTAFLKAEYELVTQVVPIGKGTISPVTAFYPEGTIVNVAATPVRNYIFSSWSGPVTDPNVNPTSVTMTAPVTVTAFVTGIPALTPSITAKTGPPSSRNWSIALSNSGKGAAANVRLQLAITQTAGTKCSPIVSTDMPVRYETIGVSASESRDIAIDFSTCDVTAKFTVAISAEANGGVGSSKVFRNQNQ